MSRHTEPWSKKRFRMAMKRRGFSSYSDVVRKANEIKKPHESITLADIKNANKQDRKRIYRGVLNLIARAINVHPRYLTGELSTKNVNDLELYTEEIDDDGYLIPFYVMDIYADNEWIPINVAEPKDEDGRVLVCFATGGIAIYSKRAVRWRNEKSTIVAWMELPKPYHMEEINNGRS